MISTHRGDVREPSEKEVQLLDMLRLSKLRMRGSSFPLTIVHQSVFHWRRRNFKIEEPQSLKSVVRSEACGTEVPRDFITIPSTYSHFGAALPSFIEN
jgi:hypothetical protein